LWGFPSTEYCEEEKVLEDEFKKDICSEINKGISQERGVADEG
jgi:hypothetical protein